MSEVNQGKQIQVPTTIKVAAPANKVLADLNDYTNFRKDVLPEEYRDYRVVSGGDAAKESTVAQWSLQATKKRVRNVVAAVTSNPDHIIERDSNSSMVTTYEVKEITPTSSEIKMKTTWTGTTGVGGFFEKTFAPKGLNRIQTQLLTNIKNKIETL